MVPIASVRPFARGCRAERNRPEARGACSHARPAHRVRSRRNPASGHDPVAGQRRARRGNCPCQVSACAEISFNDVVNVVARFLDVIVNRPLLQGARICLILLVRAVLLRIAEQLERVVEAIGPLQAGIDRLVVVTILAAVDRRRLQLAGDRDCYRERAFTPIGASCPLPPSWSRRSSRAPASRRTMRSDRRATLRAKIRSGDTR